MSEYKDPRLQRLLRGPDEIIFSDSDEPRLSRRRLDRYERAALNSLPEEELSNDDVLLELGYLPSYHKKSCCREKQR